MSDNNENRGASSLEQLALDDDRRVKSLSPSALVLRKFLRNRLAIVGVVLIVAMFAFAFIGGIISPYGESELFLTVESRVTDWAYATLSEEVLTLPKNPAFTLPVTLRGALVSAIRNGAKEAETGGEVYTLTPIGDAWIISGQVPVYTARVIGRFNDWNEEIEPGLQAALDKALNDGETSTEYDGSLYTMSRSGREITVAVNEEIAIATRLVAQPLVEGFKIDYNILHGAEESLTGGETTFAGGYTLRSIAGDTPVHVLSLDGTDVCVLAHISIQPRQTGEIIPLEMWTLIRDAIESGEMSVTNGDTEYLFSLYNGQYSIKREQDVTVVNMFERPSAAHPLGTDGNGMDVMTRLMYGGRVSLMVGFVVIIISAVIGVVLGGIAGYFGKVIDALIMRVVDVFNCLPDIPLYLILASFMEASRVPPRQRIYYLMVLMGLMSWPGIARIVRGQILSLREQEFMLAAESLGIRTSRRIFKHLVPNVIPQIIVWATMGLGSIILVESTLSFLGLGVKYPMASWGNILNSVNDMHIMTTYMFAWIPAGLMILLTVLGFNFIGDGLRDAFDPKTKR